jgi:hypothetical protein
MNKKATEVVQVVSNDDRHYILPSGYVGTRIRVHEGISGALSAVLVLAGTELLNLPDGARQHPLSVPHVWEDADGESWYFLPSMLNGMVIIVNESPVDLTARYVMQDDADEMLERTNAC